MKATILDVKKEGKATCFLCRINLKEYIINLSEDYRNYDVQREIVTNVYLDNIINTVLNGNHIPPIVLIGKGWTDGEKEIEINGFKILDGLQRTYRLNSIWRTLELFKNELKKDNGILDLSRIKLSRTYSSKLQEIESSTKILQGIIEFYKSNLNTPEFDLEYSFSRNNQWFEIWFDLSPQDEVNKMLILNAGHKPVKLKHQLELIFRNILPLLKESGIENFEVIREKEMPSITLNKNRRVGQFHFSTMISSILSIKEQKPITANSNYIQKLQEAEFDS